MEVKPKTLIFCLIFLFCSGCTTYTQLWEKDGGNQQSFDLDSRECEYIANRIALQQSETGNKADPAALYKTYEECLDAKGWQRKTVTPESEQESNPETFPQLAEAVSTTIVRGFGQTITLPEIYKLSANKRIQGGQTIIEQFSWKGADGSFINILFQKNTETTFKQIPYPVSEPFQLYTSGEGEKAEQRLQWTTYFGQKGSSWVMITGAYYYVSKKERIIFVITKPLAGPSGPLAEKATLARNQYLQVEDFSAQWQRWLNQQFPEGAGIQNILKKIFTLNPDFSL
jgi:hypothetical protein